MNDSKNLGFNKITYEERSLVDKYTKEFVISFSMLPSINGVEVKFGFQRINQKPLKNFSSNQQNENFTLDIQSMNS